MDTKELAKTVMFTFFFDSSTGQEPMVVPGMLAMDYTLTTERYCLL